MDIKVAHWYWHIREKLLPLTYGALGVKLTGMIEVCDSFERSKVKYHTVRKNKYIRDTNLGEIVFVNTTDPLTENLMGNRYWIGAEDD